MSSNQFELVVHVNKEAVDVEGLNLRLPLLDGWDDIEPRQQRYLAELAKSPTNRTLAAMTLGYKMSEVKRWESQEKFSLVLEQIEDVYTEMLKGADLEESVHNPKIRSRVIKARENGGKYTEEKKGTQHNHLHLPNNLDSLAGFLNATKG